MFYFNRPSLQWVLDKQDLMKERQKDLKFLSEEEYWKLQIFFANGMLHFLKMFHYLNLIFNTCWLLIK